VNPSDWGLRPLAADDVDAVHAIFSDPATWEHLPSGVLTRREQSAAIVQRAVADWREGGLGQWAVLLRDELVGVGGAMPRDAWWNLGFRLSPAVWGHGLGTWVASVGVGAAHRTREDWPVVARSLSTNPASARVSEAAGLELVHVEPWPDGPNRVIHADRALDRALLTTIVALG
jgi:RimJ/RimL family protein N-acetyltransferase